MNHLDNEHIKQLREEMLERHDQGLVDGYEWSQETIPIAVAEFYRKYSPYERGLIYGWWTRLHEQGKY